MIKSGDIHGDSPSRANYRRLYKACQSGFAITAFAVGRRRRVHVRFPFSRKKFASTCKYCEGCHQGDDCINICTKPPKGAGGSAVTSIGPNAGFDGDNNKNGIFPPGCTDCILAVEGRIPCPKITPNPKCQPKRICNIYRGGWTGGTVEYVIGDLPKPK